MKFRNEYYFLSNFYPCKVTLDGITYRNAEAAFQAQKNPGRAHEFASLSGAEAKRLGKRVPIDPRDWNARRLEVMEQVLRAKFAPGTALARSLIATGNAPIVEDNTWGDTFWGRCNGRGQNHLGRLLEKIRAELV